MGPVITREEEPTFVLHAPRPQEIIVVPNRPVMNAAEAVSTMGPYVGGFSPPWAHCWIDLATPSAAHAAAIRLFDIVVSLIALIVAAPALLALGAWIRLDSPGPALFRQPRLGKGRVPFTFYKFRTMYTDARDRYPELYSYSYSEDEIRTMHFKLEHDPRLTGVGRWLRKTSLDEFPNFINVLKGDMSLVGPRPELPEMQNYYEPWQRIKWRVKPGVSGYAQVQGRGYLTLQETIYWDVKYCLERSFSTYVRTLADTLWAVGKGIGAF